MEVFYGVLLDILEVFVDRVFPQTKVGDELLTTPTFDLQDVHG